MIFTLEALQAKHGDALLLYYGDENRPQIALIDGGPSGVFNQSLKPRLKYLRSLGRWDDNRLPLDLVMVSHIDDDHINGVGAFLKLMQEEREANQPASYQVNNLWHNSFEDLLDDAQPSFSTGVSAGVAAANTGRNTALPLEREAAAIVASVKQGRFLRDSAYYLGIRVNSPFPDLVSAESGIQNPIDWGGGLKLTVLGPQKSQLDRLKQDWHAKVKNANDATIAAYLDGSVYNLSSIVVLAEMNNKRILLTGDARGDNILEGLEKANLLVNGKIHVNVLKMPHHGSHHNVAPDFFERVTADTYVISANGKYDNPDIATLQLLSQARGQDEFELCITNAISNVASFYDVERASGKRYQLVELKNNPRTHTGLRFDLGSALPDGW